jgi:antitoxin component of MazEF toxin-antitoxin module
VTLDTENDKIIIQSPKYNLETMLKGITQKNQHRQIFDDEQIGNEEWQAQG